MHPERALTHSIDIPEEESERDYERSSAEDLASSIRKKMEQEESKTNDDDDEEEENSAEDLASSIRKKMEAVYLSTSIYRVPDEIVSDNSQIFVPVRISIGPFHHGSANLESMEDHKWRYLGAFMDRNLQSADLYDLVKVVQGSESRARKCYAAEIKLDSNGFNRMMLLDCCFILELLLRYSEKALRRRNDPIFTIPGLFSELRCDMILLENQVPYFLLRDIFDRAQVQLQQNYSLNELAFRFFSNLITGNRLFLQGKFLQESDHLLAMVHHCFLSTYPLVSPKDSAKPMTPHSASTLHRKGVNLKESRNPKSLLDIKFRDGVLKIPALRIHQRTETILWNLIAYEHRQLGICRQVESYVYFMGRLLQSDEDVKLLHRRKILTNKEDDETKLIREVKWMNNRKSNLSEDYFAGVIQKMNERQSRCGGLWRRLKRKGAIGIAVRVAAVVMFMAAFGSTIGFLLRRYK